MDTVNVLTLVLGAALAVVPSEGVVRVQVMQERAHGCAVREDVLLTARHVVEDNRDGQLWLYAAWSDGAGNEGRAVLEDADQARDVVLLRITSGVPGRVHPLASVAPQVGDRVRIAGYDEDHPTRVRAVETEVLGVEAGHVFYRKSPGFGSSGSCVLNAADEVVAINHAAQFDAGGSVRWGQGVSVYGVWAPELPAKREGTR